jgi:hypothetical protein
MILLSAASWQHIKLGTEATSESAKEDAPLNEVPQTCCYLFACKGGGRRRNTTVHL